MSELQIRGLGKRFGPTQVLQGLDLDVREGEFLTLLGSSGCGKSTLLRLIAGLDAPDDGTITMGGRDLLALSPSQRDCAMVFQSYALYPHMTVLENICTPLLMRGLSAWGRLPGMQLLSPAVRRQRRAARQSALQVATSLGLEALLQRKPAQLSGGQRQRVALARAMVRTPQVFLFDEPLSNLDANLRQALRAEIRQLHQRLGATFIYVTHDQHEAMSMSDRVGVMREGRILQLATPTEIYQRPADLEVARFVGSPRINLLPAELHGHGAVRAAGQTVGQAVGQAPGQYAGWQLGFRPQVGRLDPVEGLRLTGTVDALEYTGAEVVVSLQPDGALRDALVFSLPANGAPLRVGQPLRVHVALADLHLFDPQGRRSAFAALPVALGSAA